MKHLILILSLSFTLTATGQTLPDSVKASGIKVHLFDIKNHIPVTRTFICIYDSGTHNLIGANTDGNGDWIFEPVKTGNYDLKIFCGGSSQNYRDTQITGITVDTNKYTYVNIGLDTIPTKIIHEYILKICGYLNNLEVKNERVDGKKNGMWLEYISDYNLVTNDTGKATYYRFCSYKADEPYGIQRDYYKNGKLYLKTPYTHGEINGIQKEYYDNGKIKYEVPYSNGIANGKAKEYYWSGELMSTFYYKNDKETGMQKWYNIYGKLTSETEYKDNNPNGLGKEYYENGKLKSETIYTNGKAGEIKNYDENGKEIKK